MGGRFGGSRLEAAAKLDGEIGARFDAAARPDEEELEDGRLDPATRPDDDELGGAALEAAARPDDEGCIGAGLEAAARPDRDSVRGVATGDAAGRFGDERLSGVRFCDELLSGARFCDELLSGARFCDELVSGARFGDERLDGEPAGASVGTSTRESRSISKSSGVAPYTTAIRRSRRVAGVMTMPISLPVADSSAACSSGSGSRTATISAPPLVRPIGSAHHRRPSSGEISCATELSRFARCLANAHGTPF